MKRILITGKNSYIGTSLYKWLAKYPDDYIMETISLRDGSWRHKDFSKYQAVFHVAGIAHVSSKHSEEKLYYKINRDLAIEIAEKSKLDGVKQFIFMSSIIVYGNSSKKTTLINMNTKPDPNNYYGKSKLQAEEGILNLASNAFKTIILRPPMVYGKGSKGNYPKLSKGAQKLPVFPDFDNKRSMLHIDNLCEFIKLMIDNEENGLFFPQNTDYVRTSHMVSMIAKVHGKEIRLTRFFNPILRLISNLELVNKVFGDLAYEKYMSDYEGGVYQIRNFEESIELTEGR